MNRSDIYYDEFQNVPVKAHNFQQQQYMMKTYCSHCHLILCGVGYQGYQCTSKCCMHVGSWAWW